MERPAGQEKCTGECISSGRQSAPMGRNNGEDTSNLVEKAKDISGMA